MKTASKSQLRKRCDRAWFERCFKPQCEICGGQSKQVHHFFPKGQFGHLRFNLNNGISLCMGCHFRLHHQDPTTQQKIIEKKGVVWYEELRDKSREKPSSYQTIGYYNQVLKQL